MDCVYDVYLVLSRILSHGPHHPQQLLRRDGAAAILRETGSLCLQTFCAHMHQTVAVSRVCNPFCLSFNGVVN